MAEKTLEIGIIGLGKFGLRMATTLASMGHTVIGIDMSDARVQLAEELLDTVYKADATSLSVLRSLHVQDCAMTPEALAELGFDGLVEDSCTYYYGVCGKCK